jgi:hypothetical protein
MLFRILNGSKVLQHPSIEFVKRHAVELLKASVFVSLLKKEPVGSN